jgi:hypothetical protein
MDKTVINEAIKACLGEIHPRLTEAAQIAKAAEVCATARSVAEGRNGFAGYRATQRTGGAAA